MGNLKPRDFYPDFHVNIRKDGRVNGIKPVTLKDMGLPYDLDYPEQKVGDLSKEQLENLVEEFIFLIDELLPRDIQDLFYKATLDPRQAYWNLFEMAAKKMQLPYYLNSHRDQEKGIYPNIYDGIMDFVYEGRTLADIYLNTCVTKETILDVVDCQYVVADFFDDEYVQRLFPVELVLFKLSKYDYKRFVTLPACEGKADLVFYNKEQKPELIVCLDVESQYDELLDDAIDELKEQNEKRLEEISRIEKHCEEMHVAFLKFTNYQAMMLYKNDTLGDLIKKSMNDPTYAKTFLSKQNAKEQEPYPQVMSEHNMMDNGSWERILTNEEEKELGYSEPLIEMEDTDIITDLKVEYTRETKIKPKSFSDGAAFDFLTWNYLETLTIERDTETLTNHIQLADECSVTNIYYVEGGVSNLLDELYPDIFDYVEGNPDDVIDDPMEQRKYKLTVRTQQGEEKVIEGTFDKYGLPGEFPMFIEKVYDFMSFYGIGELFERSSYNRPKRRQSDYIFCDVEFETGGKTYCYIADDDSYEVNDIALVPAGHDNHQVLVRIVEKNYCSAENAPFPMAYANLVHDPVNGSLAGDIVFRVL